MQVICATGFLHGYATTRSFATSSRSTRSRRTTGGSRSRPTRRFPSLTDGARTLSLAGIAGQWAFPAADTISGAKYAARAFLRRVCRTR